ncbi:MAG TPA: dethiobiotin synthase [Chitinophagaceae bacterium]|nr:dethiobiotin synthase [Chitinophagaceae bacterium]
MQTLFITGTGTDVGKTVASAIVTEALGADYWKPVQAGLIGRTDSHWVQSMLTNTTSKVHPEAYKLDMAASPHIAARAEGKYITLERIVEAFSAMDSGNTLVIEGAGGLLVPLNDQHFVIDLIEALNARVILVSRNYLGSINHSLLTASVCRTHGLDVLGWIFNDRYLDYSQEIAEWSGYPVIGAIPPAKEINKDFILQQATLIRPALNELL